MPKALQEAEREWRQCQEVLARIRPHASWWVSVQMVGFWEGAREGSTHSWDGQAGNHLQKVIQWAWKEAGKDPIKIINRPIEEFGLNPLLLKFCYKDNHGAAQFLKPRNRPREQCRKSICYSDNWVGSRVSQKSSCEGSFHGVNALENNFHWAKQVPAQLLRQLCI